MPEIPYSNAGPLAAALFRRVGDSLLATPALRALKSRYPARKLLVVAEPGAARVFEHLDFVDVVRVCTPSPSPFELTKLLRSEGRPAATVDFLSDPRSSIASYLSGAPVRVGFSISARRILYTQRVAVQDHRRPVYSALHKLGLAKALDADTDSIMPAFTLTEHDVAFAEHLWQKLKPVSSRVIALFTQSRRSYKRWPVEKFVAFMKLALTQNDCEFLLLGSSSELAELQAIAECVNQPRVRAEACSDLGAMAAVLKRCALFLGNDGGPKHLACAIGTPTLTIFLHDPPQYWTPPDHPDHVALTAEQAQRPEDVLDAAQRILSRNYR